MIQDDRISYIVKNNVTHQRAAVFSVKSRLHYICRFQILSAISLASTKIAFLGS